MFPDMLIDMPRASRQLKQCLEEGMQRSSCADNQVPVAMSRFLLARELSNGEVRPATTSEVDALGMPQEHQGPSNSKQPHLTPPSVTSNKPKVDPSKQLPVTNLPRVVRCEIQPQGRTP